MEPMKNQLWTDKPRNFFGLAINFTRYIIPSEKFITRKGFFNIHEDEIMLYRITDKKLSLPLTQRIFKCGTITMHAKDSDTPTKVLKSIRNPRAVLEILDETGEVLCRGITETDGGLPGVELEPGQYRVRERTAPAGYAVNREDLSFIVLPDGTVEGETVLYNEKTRLVLYKVNPEQESFFSKVTKAFKGE